MSALRLGSLVESCGFPYVVSNGFAIEKVCLQSSCLEILCDQTPPRKINRFAGSSQIERNL